MYTSKIVAGLTRTYRRPHPEPIGTQLLCRIFEVLSCMSLVDIAWAHNSEALGPAVHSKLGLSDSFGELYDM
jgi:hypothetical protein